jgi:hypothetical protein
LVAFETFTKTGSKSGPWDPFVCFPPTEFAIRNSQIVESLRESGVQPSGFNIIPHSFGEPALRPECDSRFVVLRSRATWHGSFALNVGILSCSSYAGDPQGAVVIKKNSRGTNLDFGLIWRQPLIGLPGSVTLFTQMSQAVHGLVSQPVFRLGSGVFETVVAVLLLIPKTARLGAGLTVVWMTGVILSHIFVLGYGWFFVDALIVMVLAVIYVLLTRRYSHSD